MIEEAVRTTIYKARINKKYPLKKMSLGETFKLSDVDVRDAPYSCASSLARSCAPPLAYSSIGIIASIS